MATPIPAGPLPGGPCMTGNPTDPGPRPLEINPDADTIIREAAAGRGKPADQRATYGALTRRPPTRHNPRGTRGA
jgi:hypothetical protein